MILRIMKNHFHIWIVSSESSP